MQQPKKENSTQTNAETQNSNLKNISKPTRKEKKFRTSTQKTQTDLENTNPQQKNKIPSETDEPRKNKKRIKRQTNGTLVPKS